MPSWRSLTRILLASVLAAVALAGPSGCGILNPTSRPRSDFSTRTASILSSATATDTTPAAMGTPPASTAETAGQTTGPVSVEEPISSSEAKAIDAELSAIQSELDRLSVPSDNDFDSIGSGLE